MTEINFNSCGKCGHERNCNALKEFYKVVNPGRMVFNNYTKLHSLIGAMCDNYKHIAYNPLDVIVPDE